MPPDPSFYLRSLGRNFAVCHRPVMAPVQKLITIRARGVHYASGLEGGFVTDAQLTG